MKRMPAVADDFSVDWLNQALQPRLQGERVLQCHARESDIPGQTAEILLLDVTYTASRKDLPTRLVAKVTSRNSLVLEQVIANYDQYRRETAFYQEFADCGMAVPDCLYADHNPETQEMVLLLEDLSPATCPSWAATPDQVEMALASLPGFHGKWWNAPVLREKDFLVQFDNELFFSAAFHAADAAQPALESLYDSPDLTIEAMTVLNQKRDAVLRFFASRPFTLVHGDFHTKQMFFPSADGGAFAVIDWQFPFVNAGAWDFARMLSMCMATDQRHDREEQLITNYLKGLQQAGVEDYLRDEFILDYKVGLLMSQMIMTISAADTDPKLFEIECGALGVDWRDVTFDRTQRAMAEQDVLGFLKSL